MIGEVKGRAIDLVKRFQGQEIFNPVALQPSYDLTVRLATFVRQNSGLDFRRSKPEGYHWRAPPAILALCALILFVSNWDLNAAIGKFAQMLATPNPSNELLGNVIGLNPYHDYAAWQMVILAQDHH